jgi:anti-anti-sigma factor
VTYLTIERHPATDRELRLTVAGEIDMASAEQLDAAIRDSIEDGQTDTLILDLDKVGFLDSAGINVLLHGHQAATQAGISFRVTNPSDIVRRVLEITGVLAMLTEEP